jgi:hypothetical protein
MNKTTFSGCCASVAFVALGITACSKAPGPSSLGRIDAASMPLVGTVDERFQSYNIEMVEVIGGRFWGSERESDRSAILGCFLDRADGDEFNVSHSDPLGLQEQVA